MSEIISDKQYTDAVDDFVYGKGKNLPSSEVCEILIRNHPVVNKFVSEAITKKLDRISIMPYGDSLQCWENPEFTGCTSTTVTILDPKGSGKVILEVNFDRN